MSFEQLMQSIAFEQRDAGERAVIRHLEKQGLVTPAQKASEPRLTEIAQAIYCRYRNAMSLHCGQAINEWDDLADVNQLAWIAAAGEAVAQVAAMNATARFTALGAPD